MKTDSVCNMITDEDRKAVSSGHDGIIYYFHGKEYYLCCLFPRPKFDKELEKHMGE